MRAVDEKDGASRRRSRHRLAQEKMGLLRQRGFALARHALVAVSSLVEALRSALLWLSGVGWIT